MSRVASGTSAYPATTEATTTKGLCTATVNNAIIPTPAAEVAYTLTRPAITAKPTGRCRRTHTPRQLSPPSTRSVVSGTGRMCCATLSK